MFISADNRIAANTGEGDDIAVHGLKETGDGGTFFLQAVDCDVIPLPFQDEPEVFFKIAVVQRSCGHKIAKQHHVSTRATALENLWRRLPPPKPLFPGAEELVELACSGKKPECFRLLNEWLVALGTETHLLEDDDFREFFQLTEAYRERGTSLAGSCGFFVVRPEISFVHHTLNVGEEWWSTASISTVPVLKNCL